MRQVEKDPLDKKGPGKRYRILWSIIKRLGFHKVIYIFLAMFFVSALIITLVEPGIDNYLDGMWYTFVACTTIGFGDLTAVTVIGRVLTVIMAINEILLIAIIPGILVVYYTERMKMKQDKSMTEFIDKLERLPELSQDELREISEKVKRIR